MMPRGMFETSREEEEKRKRSGERARVERDGVRDMDEARANGVNDGLSLKCRWYVV